MLFQSQSSRTPVPSTPSSTYDVTDMPKQNPRLRLPPEMRIQQILDCALLAFSEHGFQGARMDGIALRCGLSKGGLYAHFKSKDALFEALLTRSIAPPDLKKMDFPRPFKVRQLATWLVDQMYDSLSRPHTITTMRLLISEGARVPHLVKLWDKRVNEPLMAMLSDALSESTAGQGRRRSVIVREPWLAAAPVLHALISQLILGEHLDIDMNHMRKVHIEMLCELLEPASPHNLPLRSGGKP